MSLTRLKFSSDLISFKCQTYKIYKIPTIAWTVVYLLLHTSILSPTVLQLCDIPFSSWDMPKSLPPQVLATALFSLKQSLLHSSRLTSGLSSNIFFKRSSSKIVVLNPYLISKLPRKLIKTSADAVPFLRINLSRTMASELKQTRPLQVILIAATLRISNQESHHLLPHHIHLLVCFLVCILCNSYLLVFLSVVFFFH